MFISANALVYFYIQSSNSCSSFVGRRGGRQPISLDEECVTSTTVKHELMHAIGFYHEQSRSDRDDYVNVDVDNIELCKHSNSIQIN